MLRALFLFLAVLGVLSAGCGSQPVRPERLAYQAFDPVLKPHAPRPYNSLLYSKSLTTLERLGPVGSSAQASIAPLLKPDSFLLLVIPQPPVRCEPEKVVAVTRKGTSVRIMLRSGSAAVSASSSACPPTPVSLIAVRERSLPSGDFTLEVVDEAGSAGWEGFSETISTTTPCFDGKPAAICSNLTSVGVSGSNS
jgi:hypothetical protein